MDGRIDKTNWRPSYTSLILRKMYPESFQEIVVFLSKLPGLGPRSGERIAFHLFKSGEIEKFATLLLKLKERVKFCSRCRNLTEEDPCKICQDPERDSSLLLIVEEPSQLEVIENSKEYKGKYFVLGSKISPWEGEKPQELPLKELEEIVRERKVKEVILAVNEELTALFLKDFLKKFPLKITRLGRGIPVGARIEYVDEATIREALRNRSEL